MAQARKALEVAAPNAWTFLLERWNWKRYRLKMPTHMVTRAGRALVHEVICAIIMEYGPQSADAGISVSLLVRLAMRQWEWWWARFQHLPRQ